MLAHPSLGKPHLPGASFPAKCSTSPGQTHSCGAKGWALNHRSRTGWSLGCFGFKGTRHPRSHLSCLMQPQPSQAGLLRASLSLVPHAAGGGHFCCCVWFMFFFILQFPEGEKQSVLGGEVLATIYIGRFAVFHANPGSGIFIVVG